MYEDSPRLSEEDINELKQIYDDDSSDRDAAVRAAERIKHIDTTDPSLPQRMEMMVKRNRTRVRVLAAVAAVCCIGPVVRYTISKQGEPSAASERSVASTPTMRAEGSRVSDDELNMEAVQKVLSSQSALQQLGLCVRLLNQEADQITRDLAKGESVAIMDHLYGGADAQNLAIAYRMSADNAAMGVSCSLPGDESRFVAVSVGTNNTTVVVTEQALLPDVSLSA